MDDCWEEIEEEALFSSESSPIKSNKDSIVDYNEKTASENATTESVSKNGESNTFSLENVSPKLLPANELCDKYEEIYDVQTSGINGIVITDDHRYALPSISKESGNSLRK